MMERNKPLLFALESTRPFGERLSRALGIPLSEHEEREFEDGEHKTRPLVSVRDRDVYVVQSLHGDDRQTPNDKLARFLFFLGAVRDASANRVTAVVPYLCYARKDRKTKSRDPITTRYVARLFEAVGVDRILTMDVHNLAAYQNAYHRTVAENLQAAPLFAREFAGAGGDQPLVVLSPDAGGMKRAEQVRQALARETGREVNSAFLEKTRSSGKVRGELVAGDLEGASVWIVDDLISTGGTMARAPQACRDRGAVEIRAAATHGLFVGDARETLDTSVLEEVVITDTVPPFRLPSEFVDQKLKILDAAGHFAEAIRRLHEGGGLEDLLEYLP